MKKLLFVAVSLLFVARSCSALVQEVSNIRSPAERLSISIPVGCSSLLRSSQSLTPNPNVEVILEKHLSAYRVAPKRPGVFNLGPITLRAYATVPKPDCGFGFYYSPGRLKYPHEELYFKDMKAHGMNTLTIQANNLPGCKPASAPESLARQLNTGVRMGLIDKRYPIVCYSADTGIVMDTYQYRDLKLTWPELVVQSIDEPNDTQVRDLALYYDAAHKAGIRIGTAVAGYVCTGYKQELPWCAPDDVGKPVPPIGHLLDIWIVAVGSLNETVYNHARECKSEVWSYMAYPVTNAPMHRWTFGLYAWKARARVNLIWAYVDQQSDFNYGRTIETPDGPLTTESMEGLSEGITDYRVLQAVSRLDSPKAQAWLKSVEARTTQGWWPRGYVRDNQDAEIPTVDMAAIRRQGLMWLRRG